VYIFLIATVQMSNLDSR